MTMTLVGTMGMQGSCPGVWDGVRWVLGKLPGEFLALRKLLLVMSLVQQHHQQQQ
jgi:hypothetical protein